MTTTTERQRTRRARLDALAQAAGYPTWGKLETAALAEQIRIMPKSEQKPDYLEDRRCKCVLVPA